MKQSYMAPELQIFRVPEDNIIATSGTPSGLENGKQTQNGDTDSFNDFLQGLQ